MNAGQQAPQQAQQGQQQGNQYHPAQVAQEFMSRTDLKGGEVEVYAQTFNWLQGFVSQEIVALPKTAFDELAQKAQDWDNLQREQEAAADKLKLEQDGELPVLDETSDPELDAVG